MTRLGWSILAMIGLAVVGFLSMVTVRSAGGGDGATAGVRFLRRPVPQAMAVPMQAIVVPVVGVAPGSIASDWGDARGGGSRAHHGTDIPAPGGTPVVAAAAGIVEKLFHSEEGGNSLYVRSPDGRLSYYYAHLAGYAGRLREGMRVRTGEPLGFVGDTGNAGAGNYHLHFGISRMRSGERWWQGEPIDPAPLLAHAGVAR